MGIPQILTDPSHICGWRRSMAYIRAPKVADPQHAITQQRGILLDHCSYTLGDDELLLADRRCGFKGGGIFLAGALIRLSTDRQPFGGRGPAGNCVNPQSPSGAKDSPVRDATMGSTRPFRRAHRRAN